MHPHRRMRQCSHLSLWTIVLYTEEEEEECCEYGGSLNTHPPIFGLFRHTSFALAFKKY